MQAWQQWASFVITMGNGQAGAAHREREDAAEEGELAVVQAGAAVQPTLTSYHRQNNDKSGYTNTAGRAPGEQTLQPIHAAQRQRLLPRRQHLLQQADLGPRVRSLNPARPRRV